MVFLASKILSFAVLMLIRLEGKVALITGGASGIGEATARLFARHGARVVVADVQEELGRAVCDDLRAGGAPAAFVRCDVTVEDDVRGAVDAAAAEHGRLDSSIVDYDAADFDRVLAVNLRGAFLGTKHAARVMIPARRGSIVTTASIASVIGGMAPHAYACSKHAVLGLTRNAAAELGQHGIRVNYVSPAAVITPLATKHLGFSIDREMLEGMVGAAAFLKGVVLKEEDVAEAVAFLASDEARFVSGHNLVVDGASTSSRPPYDFSVRAGWGLISESRYVFGCVLCDFVSAEIRWSSLLQKLSFAVFMLSRLEGKVALITGGASGIGEATARLFARHGARVVVADVQEELGRAVCDDLRAGGAPAAFVRCDVTVEDDVRGAVDAAAAEHGRLDVMFNNAGILDPAKSSIVDSDAADFDRVLAVNLRGAFLGTKHAARVMIPARRGSIVTTASIASVIGGMATHAYTCSKHAVLGLTRNAAAELGQHGIRVNCVSPAGVITPLATKHLGFSIDRETLEGMVGAAALLKGVVLKEEDVAEAVAFLASDEARFVSGHNLVVDGASSSSRPPFDSSARAGGSYMYNCVSM
ncbi:hypothetical protein Taro_046465 [Colocasia esculenta]|uniref:Ketoreductase domain-containing protein n=1 Tax=Colocasia esculenta TaxID=4460 RepID=A0A843X2C1_COLES|nr:hypothetical protein [Colocasia esculenta]